jgi:hypothetical protein
LLEARAQFESPEIPVWVRVAEHSGLIYLDLCNSAWEVIEVSPTGWQVVADPPVRFRRTKGMQPLPRPVNGGSIVLLRKFINVGSDDNWMLCLVWLVAALRPTGPYPILVLQGEQGSAKSTMGKLLRRLVDPVVAPVRTPPRTDRISSSPPLIPGSSLTTTSPVSSTGCPMRFAGWRLGAGFRPGSCIRIPTR